MKLNKPILVGGLFLSAIAFAGDVNAEFKKFMTAEVQNVAKAFEKRDAAYFDKVTTADFTEKMGNKTYTKAQSMSEMKQMFGMAKSIKCKMTLVSCKASGNVGTSVTRGNFTCIMKPMGPNDKKTHTMVMDGWEEKETWVRSGNTWKLKVLEQSKPGKSTMDGKPFDPTKMGG